MLTCKCHDKVAGKTRKVLGAASFSPARSLPMRSRPAPTTCQRGNPMRSPERARQHDCQLSPARGWGTAPAARGHGRWRRAPGCGHAARAAGRQRRGKGPRGRAARPRPRCAVGPRRGPLQPSPLRPPTLPSSAPERPPHLLGSVRLGGRGSWERGPASGAHHGHRGEAAPATQSRLPGSSFPVAPLLSRSRTAKTPPRSHPRRVTGSGGSAHAEGRGLRRRDWHPSAALFRGTTRVQLSSVNAESESGITETTSTVAWLPPILGCPAGSEAQSA